FRVHGIPIKLHVSLLVFLPYVAFVFALQFRQLESSLLGPGGSALPPAFWGVILAVALFAAILLHELAHSLVAVKSGARVRSITLMMLGGVSSLERDVSPSREAWMAFAGPLTSFCLALVAYLLYRITALPGDARIALMLFASTNALVGAFNL